MKLLMVGASGLVGSHVLDLALNDDRVEEITILVRKPINKTHAKLQVHQVDFSKLSPNEPWWKADAVICTLGTTIRTAGSKDNFRKVDFEYPFIVAQYAKQNGTQAYVLNSAMGADPNSSFFYNRVKGDLEKSLKNLNFKSLTFVRPGLIGGKREEFRMGEELAKAVTKILSPILPKKFQMNHPQKIASAILEAAINRKDGIDIITSDQLL